MRPEDFNIPKEKLQFRANSGDQHDKKLDTKPVSYLKDAWYRFRKNKASIAATVIIVLLILFAIFVPIFSKYKVSYSTDAKYPDLNHILPKSKLFSSLNIDFWDGCKKVDDLSSVLFYDYLAYEQETGHQVIKNGEYEIVEVKTVLYTKYKYKIRENSYFKEMAKKITLSTAEYEALQKYQDETNIQVILPYYFNNNDNQNPLRWYEVDSNNEPIKDINGNFVNKYTPYDGSDGYTSKMRLEGSDTYLYNYAKKNDGASYDVRVSYYDYYVYYHQAILKDGITEPCFVFGTTGSGQDILTCLASGARFSFILAIVVASVNLFVGAIIGAIEGYYGGKIDLILERIIDILASIPFMIVITLLKYHLDASHVIILFISFFLTGWTGMAGRTRMQFYRFKNQEYVLVARTLGASDGRIMFKHIFPNAIGTLITSCVLVIPSVIFSETSLSYLGIINLETGNLISVGTLLAKGNSTELVSFPHVVLFPSLFISLLMLSFNLFGNGLRDAFNPSLRGTED